MFITSRDTSGCGVFLRQYCVARRLQTLMWFGHWNREVKVPLPGYERILVLAQQNFVTFSGPAEYHRIHDQYHVLGDLKSPAWV